ncbi:MFS transporter [Thermocrinis minervae]|uniref:Predicted arabinose efflux permease, MFS family n=1 Tax=Thermocrinis minervae TaxID=381751 RepID=A0A1M6R3A8_9AQUI|nr:MFS transporter [Thermocrinis minervae]SHK26906.1 Predicted arabinose efflux permease, MFS family [Thermocrinis minervae]
MEKIKTDLPYRLESLGWTPFHTKLVLVLGITWVFDAFEVVMAGAVAKPMAKTLGFVDVQTSFFITSFLVGALVGSLLFGYFADRYGRKKLFLLTLFLYALSTFLTGFAWDFYSAVLFRILAGAGLGGEFAAIQSVIDEFMPAKHRGKVDGIIAALWNFGGLSASLTAYLLIDLLGEGIAWRFGFWVAALFAIVIVYARRNLPDSPRWLLSRGRTEEAERIVESLEKKYCRTSEDAKACEVPVFEGGMFKATREILTKYRWRFLFSASISFTILTTYYSFISLIPTGFAKRFDLDPHSITLVYTAINVAGLVGGLFVALLVDSVGRKRLGLFISFFSLLLSLFFLSGAGFVWVLSLYSLVAFSFPSVAYVVATEIYPSYIRAYVIGLLSVVGRVGGAFVPPVVTYLATKDYIYGILAFSALWFVGFLAFLLWNMFGKETKGKPLEEIA